MGDNLLEFGARKHLKKTSHQLFYTIEMIYVAGKDVLRLCSPLLFSTFQNNSWVSSIFQRTSKCSVLFLYHYGQRVIEVYICYVSVLTVIVYIDEYNPKLQ